MSLDSVGIEQFMALARAEAATAERVESARTVPAAVFEYLQSRHLPARIRVFGGARELNWVSAPELETLQGAVAPDGDTVVTGCYAGIAEAGALVILSAADHCAEAHFLAATHIAVIQSGAVIESFEDLWSRLRADYPRDMPRTMNFIVGPSRTADLGVPSKLGAHGPARVHIIVIDS
jgi:L-lactate dehydrogenase complex protein LldG